MCGSESIQEWILSLFQRDGCGSKRPERNSGFGVERSDFRGV